MMRDGPQPAATLATALGVSQPTFSRLVRTLKHDVVVGGRSRQTRYAARRRVLGVTSEEPVFVVDEVGAPRRVGTLAPVHPGFLWEGADGRPLWTPDLPWFLADLRPAGFLGRLVPRRHPELEVPEDIRLWSSDHVLRFVTRHGHDLPGHVVVGEQSLRRLLEHHVEPVDDDDYEGLAARELEGGTPGSSAAGEQPKFLTRRRRDGQIVDVLVKFSPPMDTAVGHRIADLLVCEHLALAALSSTGLAVATTRVVVGGGRTFLEVERFDRLPAPSGRGRGRRGLASLAALDDAFVGSDRHTWPSTTGALLQQRRLTALDHRAARLARAFGDGIDNSDMHLGNFSVFVDDGLHLAGAAPVYDMLPMAWAPIAGQLVARPVTPLHPELIDDDLRDDVVPAVWSFWERVAADIRLEDDLRRTAAAKLTSRRSAS